MIKTYFVFILFMSTSLLITAQNTLDWVSTLGGNGADYVSKIVTDKASNVFGVGHFQNNLGGLTSQGNYDVLVFKYAPNGTLQWLTQLGSFNEDLGKDIAIDAQGNLFITGHFRATFYYNNDSLVSQGNTDAFIAKLDSNGTILWVKGIGHSGYESGHSIACDTLGNVYATGTFEDTLAIDNQPLQVYSFLNNYMIKLDGVGNLIWHNTISTPTFNNTQDIKVSPNGQVYLTGYFRDVVEGTLGQITAYGGEDVLLACFSANGSLLWWKNMGGAFSDFGFALHLVDEVIYVAGAFQDTAYFDSFQQVSEGEFDAFLVQLDTFGNVNWVQQIGGGDDSKIFDLATLENGNVCMVGYFEGTARWDSDSLTSRNPRHVPSDIFMAEYQSNGTYLSVKQIGGLMTDVATGISIVDSNHIYVVGTYEDSVDFEGNLLVSQAMSSDIFVTKYQKMNVTTQLILTQDKLKARVFPNPIQQTATIEFSLDRTKEVDISLYNQWGQMVQKIEKTTYSKGKQAVVFEQNKLPTGCYYISIQTQLKTVQIPVIIGY